MNKIIWAKLDPGFYSNRKIIRAGRNGREVFQLALCINAARGAHGSVPAEDLEPWYVADQLRITEAEAQDGVARAIAAGLLVPNGDRVVIKGWDEDWSRRALTQPEIQANYRDRKAGKPQRYQTGITRDQSDNALSIRSDQRDQRESADNSLSDSPSDAGSGSRQARAATGAARGGNQQPLAAAWCPTEAAAAIAYELGLDLAHESETFRLDAKANGKTFADPDAAFQKWLRGSRDVGRTRAKAKGSTTRKRKATRYRLDDGTLVEEADDGTIAVVETRLRATGDQP